MKHKYNTKHFCPPCKICVWAFVLLIKYMCGLLSSFLKISMRGFVLWAFVRLPKVSLVLPGLTAILRGTNQHGHPNPA